MSGRFGKKVVKMETLVSEWVTVFVISKPSYYYEYVFPLLAFVQ